MKNRVIKHALAMGASVLIASGCQSTVDQAPLVSGEANAPTPKVAETTSGIKLVTWNVEHLAYPITAGCKPRTQTELSQLQAYANKLQADVVGLQEVGSKEAVELLFPANKWQIIMSERPDSEPYTCRQNGFTSTQQKVAFAVRKGLNVASSQTIASFGLDSRGLRHGLEIVVESPVGDIRILNVHMKSGCFVDNFSRADSDACQTFARQAPILDAWVERQEATGQAYALLGDFNHRISAPYNHLTRMLNENSDGTASSLQISTKEVIGCHPYYPAPIDHILVGGMNDKSFKSEVSVYAFDDMAVDKMLSDHCAIALTLNEQVLPLSNAVKWLTTSSEYQYLAQETYQQAQTTLMQKNVPETDWAVVMDVDETVLDNSAYQVWLNHTGGSYSEPTWNAWVTQKEATLVPGSAAFIQSVIEKGGKIALVTNRNQALDQHTWQNLIALGLPLTKENTCLVGRVSQDKKAIDNKTVFNDKDRRRQQLLKGDISCYSPDGTRHNNFPASAIVMQVGDNIEDFTGVVQEDVDVKLLLENHADEYFLLPNPMYGSW